MRFFRPNPAARTVGLCVLVLALAITACGSDDPASPDAAPDDNTPATIVNEGSDDGLDNPVTGFLVDDGSTLRVCGLLAESFPPQCGDELVALENPNDTDLGELNESAGVRWSENPVAVQWIVGEGGTLIVDNVAPAN